ncbi:MAG TPA: biotin carboxylase N-terminal domain-containing protein [Solirubrobacter sp.]|nr:biotin carboxylase N-terminal domain-containing protein [Solirubrobacter sp.]
MRVLIANRGEIAVRVIRACRDVGVSPVAVFTDVDAGAPHVRLADHAENLGAPRAYLDPAAILDAARESGADAIHPGYGFLAENAAFARAVEDAGLRFLGPKPEHIELMGDKAAARKAAADAGVPVVPGSDGTVADEEAAVAAAVQYPVAVKAAGGGGGRGIRIAADEAELRKAFAAAAREAQGAFGDPRVYVERFVEKARHIEVQVFGDVALGERECSLQRRRQKVVEEAPAPTYDASDLCSAAAALAGSIGYRGAGTLEFLVDDDTGDFFFIEMNTRIQVEHPVTEMVTGVDLIAAQITGELPPFEARGCALELRLNAEDPSNKFMPSPGVASAVRWPSGPWVRVDTWLEPGVDVPPFYDSLIGKLIVWGPDRATCIARAKRALWEFHVEGIHTTAEMLAELLDEEWFVRGEFHTTTLEEWLS